MVTTGPKLRTRDRIIEAALDLFAQQGFEATTISAIERAVGLAAGTGSLYRHFRSKDELLHAAVEHEVATVMAEIEAERAALPPIEDARAELVRDYNQVLSDVRRFDRLVRLMMTEGERFPDVRLAVTNALGLRSPDSTWHRDPAVLVAVAALSGYHFMSLAQGRPFQGVPPQQFVETVVDVISTRASTLRGGDGI